MTSPLPVIEEYKGEIYEMPPLERSDHGGLCCGIRHVFTLGETPGFPDHVDMEDEVVDSTPKIVRLDENLEKLHTFYEGICVEVVLAGYQRRTWHEHLIARGFKEVFSFYNSNSHNVCHIYLWSNAERKLP